jgi:hypothetical protein
MFIKSSLLRCASARPPRGGRGEEEAAREQPPRQQSSPHQQPVADAAHKPRWVKDVEEQHRRDAAEAAADERRATDEADIRAAHSADQAQVAAGDGPINVPLADRLAQQFDHFEQQNAPGYGAQHRPRQTGAGLAAAAAPAGAATMSFDAPLQARAVPLLPPMTPQSFANKVMWWVRKRGALVGFGAFCWFSFIGFRHVAVSAAPGDDLLALRYKWTWQTNLDVVAYEAPAYLAAMTIPKRSTLLVKRNATAAERAEAEASAAAALAIVPPPLPGVARRIANYLWLWIPVTVTYSFLDAATPEGRNTVVYNRLLYTTRKFEPVQEAFLVADEKTSDGFADVRMVARVTFREEYRRRITSMADSKNAWELQVGEGKERVRMFGEEEFAKLIRGSSRDDIAEMPRVRRGGRATASLCGYAPERLLISAADAMEAERVAGGAAAAGAAPLEVLGSPSSLLPPALETFDAEEKMRRVLAANIGSRLHGRVLIDDVTWRITVRSTGLDVARQVDPLNVEEWYV